jgi:hypothetical protein
MMRAANWDEDVIKARKLFSELKERHAKNLHEMTKYCHPHPSPIDRSPEAIVVHKGAVAEHEEISGVLRTIANDYELMSLGIRLNIIDEAFAYRYMRGGVMIDWRAISPIATAYRAKYDNQLLYLEFEGLVNAWEQHKSYLTDRTMKPTKKRTLFN